MAAASAPWTGATGLSDCFSTSDFGGAVASEAAELGRDDGLRLMRLFLHDRLVWLVALRQLRVIGLGVGDLLLIRLFRLGGGDGGRGGGGLIRRWAGRQIGGFDVSRRRGFE